MFLTYRFFSGRLRVYPYLQRPVRPPGEVGKIGTGPYFIFNYAVTQRAAELDSQPVTTVPYYYSPPNRLP